MRASLLGTVLVAAARLVCTSTSSHVAHCPINDLYKMSDLGFRISYPRQPGLARLKSESIRNGLPASLLILGESDHASNLQFSAVVCQDPR